jgi:16S rRNA (adenine1518-N6/adenine1519-N6)-dimethyltransferase
MGSYSRLVKSNAPSPKKRFGQHFLRDTGVIERIVRWTQPTLEDVFLEIGAGDGSLSRHLAPMVARYLAIEIDTECIPILEEALKPLSYATVIQGDFLQMHLGDLAYQYLGSGRKMRVAGNLPYNIATAIIEKLLHHGSPFVTDMFFMVQFEVAQRIAALPGSRQYGYLSVYCQHRSDVQLGFKVSSACFVPRPKVISSMICLRPKKPELEPACEQDFEMIAKAAFSHRRKTLANSLARHAVLRTIAPSLLTRAGIDGSRRAEQLAVREYELLARIYWKEFSKV